ncbi:MAG: uroporphyrinogen-III C-methyltransferase [Proteobacteria bacterium]|nr:uroporphyrinogen-III C-methyltransferase [Pseudomonadota bacterium]
MDYLPVFLRLADQTTVVVGGGGVALRKVTWLLQAGARVTAVAPALDAQFASLEPALRAQLTHVSAAFSASHLAGAVAVVAATDDRETNTAVSLAARARNIPVNVVDDASLSTFIFPAIIDRSPVIVAIGSGGSAPVLARRIRAQIEALLPARLGALARYLGGQRLAIHQRLGKLARRAFWERVTAGAVATRVLAGDEAGADLALQRELSAARLLGREPTGARAIGEVYLIGAGPGDPDLLTLRALQLLQQADVILHDRLVPAAILERARRDARRIFVGKGRGDAGQQERILNLMIQLARDGQRVARLKGGDPLVFGRGGEEAQALRAAAIPCQIVPGVTAALGAASAAGVPLTQRGHARSVTFVTGHDSNMAAADWAFLADPAHTAVFYMGIGELTRIVSRLRAAGAQPSHPAVIVERASLPGQRIARGTLADIAAQAATHGLEPPAVLIVGAVAALADDEAVGLLAPAAAVTGPAGSARAPVAA